MTQVNAGCHGNNDDHCCWLKGKLCPYLEENTVINRRWACGLYRELGDWDSVLADSRYTTNVKPKLDQMFPKDTVTCKNWPSATMITNNIGTCCFKT